MQKGDSGNNNGAVTARTLIDSFTTELDMAGHGAVADEPADLGGNALGPSPYEFLAAALASCTSMTLKMYAARKGLPLRSVAVTVVHDRVHAKDCEDCRSTDGYIHEFRREIAIEGDLDRDARLRMLDIADKCPVHKTLTGEIRIRSVLATA